jgi:hypothetical protein
MQTPASGRAVWNAAAALRIRSLTRRDLVGAEPVTDVAPGRAELEKISDGRPLFQLQPLVLPQP